MQEAILQSRHDGDGLTEKERATLERQVNKTALKGVDGQPGRTIHVVENLPDEDEPQLDVDPEGVPFKPEVLEGGFDGNTTYMKPDGTLDAEGDGDNEDVDGNVIEGEEIA